MRFMTFNIRFENDSDGSNHWVNRRDLLVEVIGKYHPTIFGTQEGTLRQLDYIQENLTHYALHAPHRVLDDTCQYPTLFYCQQQVEVLHGGEFWLSTTPAVHRSKNWDSAFPRMMSYALFRCCQERGQVWVVVTHLDNLGQQARLEQAAIIVKWLQQRQGPVIVMGDFNDLPGSSLHDLLVSPESGLQDSWKMLERGENGQSMTHHDFQGNPEKGRLDWILVSRHFRVREAAIVRDHREGRYPSDHFPYYVDLEWA